MCDDDHIPVSFDVRVDLLPTFSEDINDVTARIKWDNASDTNVNLYYNNSNVNLGRIPLPVSTLCCGNSTCEDQSHRANLEFFLVIL